MPDHCGNPLILTSTKLENSSAGTSQSVAFRLMRAALLTKRSGAYGIQHFFGKHLDFLINGDIEREEQMWRPCKPGCKNLKGTGISSAAGNFPTHPCKPSAKASSPLEHPVITTFFIRNCTIWLGFVGWQPLSHRTHVYRSEKFSKKDYIAHCKFRLFSPF